MLMRYEGNALLPLEIKSLNGGLELAYDISGTQTLLQLYDNQEFNEETLRRLFSELWRCCEEMEEYLLPLEGILMKPEQIYWISAKNQFRFCFHPGVTEEFQQSFLSLTEFCMKHTEHQDAGAVMFIYGLYRLLQDEHIENEELRSFLKKAGAMQQEKVYEKSEAEVAEEQQARTVTVQQEKTYEGAEALRAEARQKREITMRQEKTDEGTEAAGTVGRKQTKQNPISEKTLTAESGRFYLYIALTGTAFLAAVIFALRYWVFCGYEADCKFMIFAIIVFAFFLYSTIQMKQRMSNEEKEQR